MTPHKQLFRHEPEKGIYGDCYRTAVACLLDIEPHEIPHAHADHATAAEYPVRRWLEERGLMIVTVNADPSMTMDEVLEALGQRYPGVHCLLGGASPRGDCDHVVIVRDGQMVWDVSEGDGGLVGPSKTSGFWSAEFIARRT